MREIRFLYNEIEEKVNKDVEELLFSLRHPLANKQRERLMLLTRSLVLARAKQLSEARKRVREEPRVKGLGVDREAAAQGLAPTSEFRASVVHECEAPVTAQTSVSLILEEHPPKDVQQVLVVDLIVDHDSSGVLARAEISDRYLVYEPELSESEEQLVRQAKKDIGKELWTLETERSLMKQLHKSAKAAKVSFFPEDYLTFKYYLVRDLLSYNVVEPLTHDAKVEKIICDGPGIPLVVIREGKKLSANILFKGKDDLNEFLLFAADKTFQKISIEEPVLDAVFRGFRIQGILGTDVVSTKFIMTRV